MGKEGKTKGCKSVIQTLECGQPSAPENYICYTGSTICLRECYKELSIYKLTNFN